MGAICETGHFNCTANALRTSRRSTLVTLLLVFLVSSANLAGATAFTLAAAQNLTSGTIDATVFPVVDLTGSFTTFGSATGIFDDEHQFFFRVEIHSTEFPIRYLNVGSIAPGPAIARALAQFDGPDIVASGGRTRGSEQAALFEYLSPALNLGAGGLPTATNRLVAGFETDLSVGDLLYINVLISDVPGIGNGSFSNLELVEIPVAPVPEPGTLSLTLMGMIGLALHFRSHPACKAIPQRISPSEGPMR